MSEEFESQDAFNDIDIMFKGDELSENKDSAKLKNNAIAIWNTFVKKENYYKIMQNSTFIYTDWITYNEAYLAFLNNFRGLQNDWNRAITANSYNQYVDFFTKANEPFKEIDKVLEETIFKSNYQKEMRFKEDAINEIKSSISLGIQELIQFKGKMNLEGSLKTHVESEKNSSFKMKWAFCSFLVIVILFIPVTLIFVNEIEYIKKLSLESQYSIKIGISISFLVLSYFFFSQYRLYQLIHIKYSHLDGLLGGGAEYLNQIYNFSEETQKALDLKVINLILEITDVFNLIKQSKHPAEMSLTEFSKVVNGMSQVKNKIDKSN